MCRNCYDVVSNFTDNTNIETDTEAISDCDTEDEMDLDEKLNESLHTIGISPVKLHGIPKYQRLPAAQKKLKKTISKYE